jgi:hypothetical protein
MLTRLLILAFALPIVPWLTGPPAIERQAVEQAALDYVTAVYEAKPELIARSVSPHLVKLGFVRQPKGTYRQAPMTYEQLLEVARTWNANGQRDTSVRKVEVLDVLDQTATAKLTAAWGVDYMQLARVDGVWKILHIVWQTPPPAPSFDD